MVDYSKFLLNNWTLNFLERLDFNGFFLGWLVLVRRDLNLYLFLKGHFLAAVLIAARLCLTLFNWVFGLDVNHLDGFDWVSFCSFLCVLQWYLIFDRTWLCIFKAAIYISSKISLCGYTMNVTPFLLNHRQLLPLISSHRGFQALISV